jgi:peptidoglycan/xylan/chitin deacetylase (PgdA/CDA1 family)
VGVVRTAGKKVLEGTMIAAGVDRLGQRLRRGRSLILAYHNVVPDSAPPAGDRSLHLRVSEFGRQLDLLRHLGRVVSLEELLSGVGENRHPMAFAVTFDDGYRGAATLGVRELERRGLPATIFVAPGLVGDQTFWWDALAMSNFESRASALRQRILTEGMGMASEVRRLALAGGHEMEPMPELWRSAVDTELLEAAAVDGITIGSHSWGHPSLVELAGATLHEEINRPREWLRDRFGARYLDVLAYPYGLHSAAVRRAARSAGYRAGLALAPASLRVAGAPQSTLEAFSLPRLNVPSGLTLSGLRLRAAWC